MSESNIITPGFGENTKAEQEQEQPKVIMRLSVKQANEIGGALHRLRELQASKIETPTTQAEVSGLQQYLVTNLINYAPELLGCWFAIRNEYEPLVNVITNIAARVAALRPAPAAQCPCKQ